MEKKRVAPVDIESLCDFRESFRYPPEILEMSLKSIRSFFKKKSNPCSFRDSYHNNILHLACSIKPPNKEVILFLLGKKMDLSMPNIHGMACFHYMCQYSSEYHDLMMLLLLMSSQKDHDLKALSHSKSNCLHFACKQTHVNLSLVTYLLAYGFDANQASPAHVKKLLREKIFS